jgi:hypothetical protein
MSPRISLWQDDHYSTDAKFFDKHVNEQFTLGGTTAHIYLYLGSENQNIQNDATQPVYPNLSANNIQDLLFLENRDRKYRKDIFRLRCHYNVSELELDLSSFGLMISAGTLFITFHLNNMVDTIGRKLMAGDVLELPHLKEFYSLDETLPVALKRFYVIQDASKSAQGYSPSWNAHLWRVKCTPMVDSQEYSDILNQIVIGVNGNPVLINGNTTTYGNITSSINTYQEMNAAIIKQAEYEVPESGYNTDALWEPQFIGGKPKNGPSPIGSSPEQKFTGYLVGDGKAINGYPVFPSTEFPPTPTIGQYILRQDYFPARLYRWDGKAWKFVNDDVRTPLTLGKGQTQRDTFINNANTFVNGSHIAEPHLQSLDTLFRPDKKIPTHDGDIYMENIIPYYPNPVFDLALGSTQIITLNGNATPSFINPIAKDYNFVIIQDINGGHSFDWPSNFKGAGIISISNGSTNANTSSSQSFVYEPILNKFIATTTMISNVPI